MTLTDVMVDIFSCMLMAGIVVFLFSALTTFDKLVEAFKKYVDAIEVVDKSPGNSATTASTYTAPTTVTKPAEKSPEIPPEMLVPHLAKPSKGFGKGK